MHDSSSFLTFHSSSFATESQVTSALMQRTDAVRQSACSEADLLPALPCLEDEFIHVLADACRSLFSYQRAEFDQNILSFGCFVHGKYKSFSYYSVSRLAAILAARTASKVGSNICYTTVAEVEEMFGGSPALLERLIFDSIDLIENPRTDRSIRNICAHTSAHTLDCTAAQEELLMPCVFDAIAFLSCLLVNILEYGLNIGDTVIQEIRVVHSDSASCLGRDLCLALCCKTKADIELLNSQVSICYPKCTDIETLFDAVLERLVRTSTLATSRDYYTVAEVYGCSLLLNTAIDEHKLKELKFVRVEVIALDSESDVAMYASTADTLGKFVPIYG